MLTTAGLQVPRTPLSDVVGSTGTLLPWQMASVFPMEKVVVTTGFTVTAKDAGTAHWPASGVKVYVPEFWLSTVAGFQVPVIPFVEVAASAGTTPPAQTESEVPKVKVGVRLGLTVTVYVNVVAHTPAEGVKV